VGGEQQVVIDQRIYDGRQPLGLPGGCGSGSTAMAEQQRKLGSCGAIGRTWSLELELELELELLKPDGLLESLNQNNSPIAICSARSLTASGRPCTRFSYFSHDFSFFNTQRKIPIT
jgi:hypothetical protein